MPHSDFGNMRRSSQWPWADPRRRGRLDHVEVALEAGQLRHELGFTLDSPLEEAGFEPLVPRHAVKVSRAAHVASALISHRRKSRP